MAGEVVAGSVRGPYGWYKMPKLLSKGPEDGGVGVRTKARGIRCKVPIGKFLGLEWFITGITDLEGDFSAEEGEPPQGEAQRLVLPPGYKGVTYYLYPPPGETFTIEELVKGADGDFVTQDTERKVIGIGMFYSARSLDIARAIDELAGTARIYAFKRAGARISYTSKSGQYLP